MEKKQENVILYGRGRRIKTWGKLIGWIPQLSFLYSRYKKRTQVKVTAKFFIDEIFEFKLRNSFKEMLEYIETNKEITTIAIFCPEVFKHGHKDIAMLERNGYKVDYDCENDLLKAQEKGE